MSSLICTSAHHMKEQAIEIDLSNQVDHNVCQSEPSSCPHDHREPEQKQISAMKSIFRYARMFTLHLNPVWFTMTMGTGEIALFMKALPYKFNGSDIIGIVFFGIALFSFLLFLTLSVVRFLVWPQVLSILLHSPQSEFFGALPMGLSTLLNFCALHFVSGRSGSFRFFVWALWWVNVAVSVLFCCGIMFLKSTRHSQSLGTITGIWLLPIIAVIVAGGSGSIISESLPAKHAKITIVLSYMLLGGGLCVTFFGMTLYYARLAFHKVPAASLIITVFIPLGPCAQTAFAFLRLSTAISELYSDFGQPLIGSRLLSSEDTRIMNLGIQGCSILMAVGFWGLSFFWLSLSLSIWIDTWIVTKLKFNPGWWGAIFPLGIYALSTIEMGTAFDSGAFKKLSIVFGLCAILVWLLMVSLTLYNIARGKVYVCKMCG